MAPITSFRAHPAFGVGTHSCEIALLESTVHWIQRGDGPPIVFLHGNPTSAFLWRHVIGGLDGVGRLLAPDLIGFGRSGKPDLAYTLADHEAYLDAWFDALGLDDVTLVVQDFGALLGVSWARRHPERVRSLVLLEPVLRALDSAEMGPAFAAARSLFTGPGDGERYVLEENRFLTQLFPSTFAQPLAPEVLAAYLEPFPDAAARRPVLAFPRALPVDDGPPATTAIVEANSRWLAESETPKLLLTFEPGFLVTPRILAWARAHVRNLEVRDGGAGVHYVQEEQPEAIATAVREWVGR